MHAYEVAGWSDFFVATAGAAAALAGLLFVAISINLDSILADPGLPGRAGETIVLLLGSLLAAAMSLIPGQTSHHLGAEMLFVAVIAWFLPVRWQIQNARRPQPAKEYRLMRALLTQYATLPLIFGSISLIVGWGGGLYWVAAGILHVFVVTGLSAWILMIEIKR